VLKKPLPYVDAHSLRVMGIELLCFGALLAAAVLVRRALATRGPSA
jgi:hypothetical protein